MSKMAEIPGNWIEVYNSDEGHTGTIDLDFREAFPNVEEPIVKFLLVVFTDNNNSASYSQVWTLASYGASPGPFDLSAIEASPATGLTLIRRTRYDIQMAATTSEGAEFITFTPKNYGYVQFNANDKVSHKNDKNYLKVLKIYAMLA